MNTTTFNKLYSSNEYFTYYNANPEGASKRTFKWDRCDCSIRALAKAANIDWVDAFDFLSSKARRDFNVVNDFGGCRKWYVESGAKWCAVKAEKGKSRMTIKDFALTHKDGRYIVQVAGHFTSCVDGVIYDVWNCGEKAVVGYYDMENFSILK